MLHSTRSPVPLLVLPLLLAGAASSSTTEAGVGLRLNAVSHLKPSGRAVRGNFSTRQGPAARESGGKGDT